MRPLKNVGSVRSLLFSIVVIHNQGNAQKKGFIWAHGSRDETPSSSGNVAVRGRHWLLGRKLRAHILNLKKEAKKMKLKWFSNSQSLQ